MRQSTGNRPPAGSGFRLGLLTSAVATAVIGASPAASAGSMPTAGPATVGSAVTVYSGSLPNGATWKAELPANWNRTLLLYSHGYLPTFAGAPNVAWDAPDPQTGAALL